MVSPTGSGLVCSLAGNVDAPVIVPLMLTETYASPVLVSILISNSSYAGTIPDVIVQESSIVYVPFVGSIDSALE